MEPYHVRHPPGVRPARDLLGGTSGNPEGKPVVFLHGGPGGGSDPKYRRFFDPERYRIVLFDQRGCGRARPTRASRTTPPGTSWPDIERLREHLGIARWQVFGGSWGSTLALAYAETHPERVTSSSSAASSCCAARRSSGSTSRARARSSPTRGRSYLAPIPEAERGDLVHAYHKRLTGDDPAERSRCAVAWSVWEGSTSRSCRPGHDPRTGDEHFAEAFARIECHYFVNKGFLRSDDAAPRGRAAHPATSPG
jgi:proline iminopeptidase